MSINEQQFKGALSGQGQPGTQKGLFTAYAMQNVPSPNITNRALSLSTNLGKPGNGTVLIQGVPGKNKQQSI